MNMTLQNAINRGYNLLACTALALAGLAFGTVVFEEADLLDKVDDIGFLVIGAVAIIWYLVSHNRFKRSVVPLVLSGIAIIVQVVGLVVEKDDPASFRRQHWRNVALRATLRRPDRAVFLELAAPGGVSGDGARPWAFSHIR